MMERKSKAERIEIAIEAGQRMAVFMEDPYIQEWFEREHASLMQDMMSNPLDTARIQSFIMAVRTLAHVKAAMAEAVTVAEKLQSERGDHA